MTSEIRIERIWSRSTSKRGSFEAFIRVFHAHAKLCRRNISSGWRPCCISIASECSCSQAEVSYARTSDTASAPVSYKLGNAGGLACWKRLGLYVEDLKRNGRQGPAASVMRHEEVICQEAFVSQQRQRRLHYVA